MRFVTFAHAGSTRAGVLQGDGTRPTDVIFDPRIHQCAMA